MHKALTIVAAAASFLAIALPTHADNNKLLGGWTMVKGTCAQRHFHFVEGAEIVDEAYPGFAPSRSTYSVSYNNANPRITYVTGNAGHIAFKFLSTNRVLMDNSNQCEYVRA